MDETALATVLATEGMLGADEAALLYRLASEAHGVIVEVGSYRGRSAVALALGSRSNGNHPVYAIDPHAEFTEPGGFHFGRADAVAMNQNLIAAGVTDLVRPIELPARMVHALPDGPISLLWIDGDHEAALADYWQFAPLMAACARVAFHDTPLPNVQAAIAEAEGDGYRVIETCGLITVLERGDA